MTTEIQIYPPCPEFTLSLSPRAAHLTRSRGMLAHLLWSLPSVFAYLLFCRGSGAIRYTLYAIRFTLHEIALYICRERSTNQLNYAKQTQFSEKSNELKVL